MLKTCDFTVAAPMKRAGTIRGAGRRPPAGARSRRHRRAGRRRGVPQRRGGAVRRGGGGPGGRARRAGRRVRHGRGRPRGHRVGDGRRRRRSGRHHAARQRDGHVDRCAGGRGHDRARRRHRLCPVHRGPLPRQPIERPGQRGRPAPRHGLVRSGGRARRRHRRRRDGRADADRTRRAGLDRAGDGAGRADRGGSRQWLVALRPSRVGTALALSARRDGRPARHWPRRR